MKHLLSIAVLGVALATAGSLLTPSLAQDGGVTSLRGDTPLDETTPAPDDLKQEKKRFGRAYRQQPPLIPHRIEKYQIDTKVNQCMHCHDWPNSAKEGAPKISETHYVDRQGVALDHVARTRWFCTQCHVPQADAPALVPNDFKNSMAVEE